MYIYTLYNIIFIFCQMQLFLRCPLLNYDVQIYCGEFEYGYMCSVHSNLCVLLFCIVVHAIVMRVFSFVFRPLYIVTELKQNFNVLSL